MVCQCRQCGTKYESTASPAPNGYCSEQCALTTTIELGVGFKLGNSRSQMIQTLQLHGAYGHVPNLKVARDAQSVSSTLSPEICAAIEVIAKAVVRSEVRKHIKEYHEN